MLYDISLEKRINDLELPEYILGSPTKKARNDDDIPDIDEVHEENKETIDLDDPDYEYSEEEEDEEEFEKPKSKRCTMNFRRTTAAAIRFGISIRAITIIIWALLMGKHVLGFVLNYFPYQLGIKSL